MEKLYNHALLPQRYWDTKISLIPDKPYKKIVKDWVTDFKSKMGGSGLFIYGPYGTGKSAVGSILIKASLAHGIPAMWLNFKELQNISIKPEENMFSPTKTMIDRAMEVDFLFVDEFQVKANQHWPISVLEDIVRIRFQNMKTTCIASNVTPATVAKTEITIGLSAIMMEAMEGLLVEGKNFRKKN